MVSFYIVSVLFGFVFMLLIGTKQLSIRKLKRYQGDIHKVKLKLQSISISK